MLSAIRLATIAAVVTASSAVQVHAELVLFTLSQPNSSLTLSGTATVAGVGTFALEEQAMNSLITSYTGSILVDVDNTLNPTSIAIISATLDAAVNGTWAPANGGATAAPSAPADYGIAVPSILGTGKARDVVFNLAAGATGVAAGSFALGGQSFSYTSGTLDVHSAALIPPDGGSAALTGAGGNTNAGNGTYAVVGNMATLTIPTQFQIGFVVPGDPLVTGTTIFNGTFVGVSTIPEPAASLWLAITCMGLSYRGRRRC